MGEICLSLQLLVITSRSKTVQLKIILYFLISLKSHPIKKPKVNLYTGFVLIFFNEDRRFPDSKHPIFSTMLGTP